MLTLRLNRAMLGLAALIFVVSTAVHVTTYGGVAMLPYIQWFTGAAGLISMALLMLVMLLSVLQAGTIGRQLPVVKAVKGLRWLLLAVAALGVYSLYNLLFAGVPYTLADPLPSHLSSIRNQSITSGMVALLASSYLYCVIAWQRGRAPTPPAPHAGINTP